MPVAISNDVKISVETYYQNDKVNNTHGKHMFAYRIVIENKSDYTIKLLRRHWDIIDCLGEKRVVDGEGVIGETPTLEPNQSFTYSSGCNFGTEIGKMGGFYIHPISLHTFV
jgi:ApaG protein